MNQILEFIFYIISYILNLLPFRIQRLCGAFIGILWFDIFRIRRKLVIQQVRDSFPEMTSSWHLKIARQSLLNLGQTVIEILQILTLKQVNLEGKVTYQGEEHYKKALAKGKGVLILSLHLGNGDLGCMALCRKGYKLNLISKQFKSLWLNRLWFGVRQKNGMAFIPEEKSQFLILRALKRNEAVLFILDQFMGPPIGTKTVFFGRDTGTAMGLALFHLKTGAPILPGYTFRDKEGKHRICFEPEMKFENLPEEVPLDQKIAFITQAATSKIEDIVRKCPEQWMWVHRRWKKF